MESTAQTVAQVQKPAPHFKAMAYWDGKLKEISLDMFKGQYVLLVWYPLDFTFVCPTEILDFSDKAKLFEDEKCQVIFASVDSQFAHKEFALKDRKKGGLNPMNVPMMSDLSHKISKSYGCYLDSGNDEGVTLRATYIIDGNGILRHLSMNDLPVGRNADEYLRLVQAFKYTDENGEVCPAAWKRGKATMKPDHDEKIT